MNKHFSIIEKLVYKGFGLTRFEEKIIFIPYTVPEDEIEFSVIAKKRNHDIGKLESLKKPSRFRVSPSCEVFEKCGGCNWLNIDYSYQLTAKTEIIKELYSDESSRKVMKICPSPLTNYYRNKVFYPVSHKKDSFVFGIYASQSHQVIPHKKCQLVPDIIDNISKILIDFFTTVKEQAYNEETHSGNIRHIGFRISQNHEVIVIIVTKRSRLSFTNGLKRTLLDNFPEIVGIVQNINPIRGNTIISEHEKLLHGEPYFIEKVHDLKFKVNYQSFFQINVKVANLLFQYIIRHLQKEDTVVDAFCGIGIIALLISKYVKKVIGIESNKQAYLDALENEAINNIKNVTFLLGKVEDIIIDLIENDSVNTIIFDPPRKGLDASILEIMNQSNIKKIIYISCDPLTQKRDISKLMKEDFVIEQIQPFDMFPHTFHIENVIILKRR